MSTTMNTRTAERPPRSAWSRAQDLSVRTKIITSVVIAALVGMVVGVLGISALSSSNDDSQAMYSDNFVGLDTAAELEELTLQMRLDAVNHAVSVDAAAKAGYASAAEKTESELRVVAAEYGRRDPAPEQVVALQEFGEALEAYSAVRDGRLTPLSEADDMAAWVAARDEAGPVIEKMLASVEKLVESEKAAAVAAA
jgi:methyl-accepting chemotaxis protein